MIGIISALDEELLEIIKNLNTEIIKIRNFNFYKTKIHNKDVVLGICGIGKVNSAMYTQAMIDNFNTDIIINIGVAGSTDDRVKIGDLVIGTKYVYHDFDCTEAGYKIGEIPGFKGVDFIADEYLLNLAYSKSKEIVKDANVFKGTIASGDIFVAKQEIKDRIKNNFDSLCCEMESCSITHVCHVNDVKYLALRSISDNANEHADIDFGAFVEKSAKVCKDIILDLVKDI